MNIKAAPYEIGNLSINNLGQPAIASPYDIDKGLFVTDDIKVPYHTNTKEMASSGNASMFEIAGPRQNLFFDPTQLTCGIVTCGGLCPGLNDVVRTITLTLLWQYGVKQVLGFRYGYQGMSSNAQEEPLDLSAASVRSIQHLGGTILGSSRGAQDPADMVTTLVKHNVSIIFTIGGDGTFTGAHALAKEINKQKLNISVIGIPKTIDNDICCSESTFGFSTAFEEARRSIGSAHTEARGAWNGIGLVKLMGRDSGFITAAAMLANSDVNFCLIPEVPVVLDGPDGLFSRLEKRLARKHHSVIVVAEGAGRELMEAGKQTETDPSGNVRYDDIGVFLKKNIKQHFKNRSIPVSIKYIDPSYNIRSCQANARDSILCLMLGENAVHAGMAGKTDMFIGYWNQNFTHVPFTAAIGRRKKIDLNSQFWQTIRATTE
jgi:6-phosphofructokinase 1